MKMETRACRVRPLLVFLILATGCGGPPERPPQQEEALSLSAWGHDAFNTADLHIAGVRFQKALRQSRAIDDQHAIARDLHNYGMVLLAARAYTQASAYLEESAELHRRNDQSKYLAVTLLSLGEARFHVGDTAGASRALEEVVQKAKDKGVRSRAHASLGSLATAGEDFDRARNHYVQAKKLAKAADDDSALALAINNLGRLHARQGGHTRAVEMFVQATDLFRKNGVPAGIAASLSNWAESALALTKTQDGQATPRDLAAVAFIFRRAAHAARSLARYEVAAAQFAQAALLFVDAGERLSAERSREEARRMLEEFELERFRNYPHGWEGPEDPDTLREAERLRQKAAQDQERRERLQRRLRDQSYQKRLQQ